jgi:large subunit ribosomal protein L6
MSRIGKQPITIPEKVKVSIQGNVVKIEGPKGKAEHVMSADFEAKLDNNVLTVVPKKDAEVTKSHKSFFGMEKATLQNKVKGVSEEYVKVLQLEGVGYRANLQGTKLNFTLGFSHPVSYDMPAGIKAVVDNQTKITISGVDKQLVGLVASKIKHLKKPEPYQGKGVRYEGERIRRKAGKSAAGAKGAK